MPDLIHRIPPGVIEGITGFSFLVRIPAMHAATGYEPLKAWKSGGAAHRGGGALGVG